MGFNLYVLAPLPYSIRTARTRHQTRDMTILVSGATSGFHSASSVSPVCLHKLDEPQVAPSSAHTSPISKNNTLTRLWRYLLLSSINSAAIPPCLSPILLRPVRLDATTVSALYYVQQLPQTDPSCLIPAPRVWGKYGCMGSVLFRVFRIGCLSPCRHLATG